MVCQICFCEYEEKEVEILSCTHFFCKDCISGWIRSQVSDGKVSQNQIFCPNVDCKKPIDADVIEARSDPEVLEKYRRFTFAMEVDRDKNATWCPAAGCNQVIYRPSGMTRKGVCESCGFEICFECKQVFHGYLSSCTREVDEKFDQFAREQFMKRCPSCDKFIIKLDGCNHMTCSCGHQFCWICGGRYYDGHFAPFNVFGCPGMQFVQSNGICTNNIIMRILFKLIQIILLLVLGSIILALQCGIIGPLAAIIGLIGLCHLRRTGEDNILECAKCFFCVIFENMPDDD